MEAVCILEISSDDEDDMQKIHHEPTQISNQNRDDEDGMTEQVSSEKDGANLRVSSVCGDQSDDEEEEDIFATNFKQFKGDALEMAALSPVPVTPRTSDQRRTPESWPLCDDTPDDDTPDDGPTRPDPPPKRPPSPSRRRSKRRCRHRRRDCDDPPSDDPSDDDPQPEDEDSADLPAPGRDSSLLNMLRQLDRTDDSFADIGPESEAPAELKSAAVDRVWTVRVQADGRIIRLQMKPSDPLRPVFELVASELAVPLNRVCLGQGDVVYQPDHTPDDVQLGRFDVIDFWEGDSAGTEAAAAVDCVELKVQSADRRSTLMLRLQRTQPMSVLMQKYAAERGLELDQIRFRFDGDPLDPTDTPETLDLDGGECVDVYDV